MVDVSWGTVCHTVYTLSYWQGKQIYPRQKKLSTSIKYNQEEYTLPCPVFEVVIMQELSLSVHSFKLGHVESLSWLRFIWPPLDAPGECWIVYWKWPLLLLSTCFPINIHKLLLISPDIKYPMPLISII